MKTNTRYDVVVIGAGMGGLVCGCYLAKAGMSVLIAEQHSQPGGYCTSFKRGGFTFDVGVHYLGSCSKGRMLYKILNELGVYGDITFNRINPSDVVILQDLEIPIKNDCMETAEVLAKKFPYERENIYNFFRLINEKNFLKTYYEVHKLTFNEILSKYFKDERLKSFFMVLLGNIGLSSKDVAAVTAIVMYRQFVFDGGYYPRGSMQKIPDVLAAEFKKSGGQLLLSSKVDGLRMDGNKISSVLIGDEEVSAKYVVSNSDPKKTFEMISGGGAVSIESLKRMQNLKPSVSAFIIYLGVKSIDWRYRSSVWYFDMKNADSPYEKAYHNVFNVKDEYVICTFPSFHDNSMAPVGYDSMSLIVAAPNASAENNINWRLEKEAISDVIIDRVRKKVFPGLGEIKVKVAATPKTLERYTSNSGGALYGWASIPSQIDRSIMPYNTAIDNLFLAGHWVTPGLGQGGITGAATSGRVVAKAIMQKIKNDPKIEVEK
ncbi:MAG: NAD(P)/FAD-dependent oxidoreductase [Candidatus Omnitrophota bacterium]